MDSQVASARLSSSTTCMWTPKTGQVVLRTAETGLEKALYFTQVRDAVERRVTHWMGASSATGTRLPEAVRRSPPSTGFGGAGSAC